MPVPATSPSPRRVTRRTLGLGIGSLVVAGMLAWSPAAASGWSQGSAEATLWQLLNGARSNNGMAPVQSDGTLIGLARWRSADMLASDYFSHTIPACGCLVYSYYDSNGLSYVWGGENIGWNSGLDDAYSPVRVHEQFMGSAGHRSNVLNASFTHGGVGAAAADNQMFQGYVQNTRMYTELFMQAASAPAPAPAPQPAPQPAAQPAPQPAPAPSSGGGGTATRPAATATAPTARATRAREAEPKHVSVDAPARPRSTAGIDGVATVVSAPRGTALGAHLRADEIAAVRVAAMPAKSGPTTAVAPPTAPAAPLEVTAAEPAPGVLEGIVGAILGFLFG